MNDALQKHTLNLFAGDCDKLESLYPGIAVAIIIRNLIHIHIERKEQEIAAQAGPTPEMKVKV